MPKPTIGTVLLVGFKHRIHRLAVQYPHPEIGAGHVIKRAHIEGKCRCVVQGISRVNVGQTPHQGAHNGGIPPDNPAVEQCVLGVGGFKIGVTGQVFAQVSAVLLHPVVVQDGGFVAAKQMTGVIGKKGLNKRILDNFNVRNIGDKNGPNGGISVAFGAVFAQ